MAGDSLLANYQPGEVIHELVIDSRRGATSLYHGGRTIQSANSG